MWGRKGAPWKLVYRDSAQCLISTFHLTREYMTKTVPIIRTLDPERLQASDYLDISNFTRRRIVAGLEDGCRIKGTIFYNTTRDWSRFPPKTQGFLYYHRYPHLPHTTGEIRFRVTESSDPTCFNSGTDLMRLDGALPWSIPLLQLRTMHVPLKKLLIQDHNIPVAILERKGRWSGVFLTYLEQPFVVTLESHLYISMVDSQLHTGKSMMRILFPMPGKSKHSVFKGKCLDKRLFIDYYGT